MTNAMEQKPLSLTDVGVVYMTVRGMPEGQTLLVGTIPTEAVRGREWKFSDVTIPQTTCDELVTAFTDRDEDEG